MSTVPAVPRPGALALGGWQGRLLAWCHAVRPGWPGGEQINRTLRGPLRKRLPAQVDIRTGELILRLRSRGNHCETRQLLAPQFYDADELSWLTNAMHDGGVFLDIGGNVGLYSLHLASRCRLAGIRVLCVEPDPELTARLRYNAQANGLDIEILEQALSDHDGVARLQRCERQRGENRLLDDTTDDACLEVPVGTLARLCQRHGIDAIQAMKIDVEGHEARILRPFFATTPRTLWPRTLVIEHTSDAGDLIAALQRDWGYHAIARTRRNLLLRFGTP